MGEKKNSNLAFLLIGLIMIIVLVPVAYFLSERTSEDQQGTQSVQSQIDNENGDEETVADKQGSGDETEEAEPVEETVEEKVEEPVEESKLTDNEVLLIPNFVCASSELAPYVTSSKRTKVYTYFAEYVADGNLDSAWNEGVDGAGIGETLTFYFPEDVEITGCLIFPGFYKDEKTFFENSAVATLDVESCGENRRIYMDFVASKYSEKISDKLVTFDEPLIVENGEVTATIVSVRDGNGYSDTCISELWFIGHGLKENNDPEIGDLQLIHDDPTKYVDPADYPDASVGPSTSIKK